jgi:hypothetical protein
MNTPKQQPTEPTTGSETRGLTVAVISAWACIGVAVIAAALLFLS